MIEEPRQSGSYSLRQLDCRRAIEAPVRVMIGGSATPFYDFESLLHAILPAAREVGWTEDEVQSALEAIVHDLRSSSRRN